MQKVGIIYLCIATLSYGALQVIDKIVLNSGVDSSAYTIFRVFISMLFLSGVILLRRKNYILTIFKRDHLKDLIIIGILASGLGLLFQIIGLSLTTATNTSIILTFVAPLTSLFAFFVLKEPMPKMFLYASLLMLIGSLIIIYKPVSALNTGDLLVFLAVIGFAYSNVYAKRSMKNIPTEIVTLGRLFFGALSIALFLPFLNFDFSSLLHAPFWVLLGGLVFGIRMVSYYKGIELEGPSIAATFLLFSPVVTVLLATAVLKESLTVPIIGGLITVIIGGLLLTRVKLKA